MIIVFIGNNLINLYLFSSLKFCFYLEEDNSVIEVGGNMIYGIVERKDIGSGKVKIDLMNGSSINVNEKFFNVCVDFVDNIV